MQTRRPQSLSGSRGAFGYNAAGIVWGEKTQRVEVERAFEFFFLIIKDYYFTRSSRPVFKRENTPLYTMSL